MLHGSTQQHSSDCGTSSGLQVPVYVFPLAGYIHGQGTWLTSHASNCTKPQF